MNLRFVILTEGQAASVAGQTSPGAELAPAVLADSSTYVLPEAVLADPAHVSRLPILAVLPVREVADEEWPPVHGPVAEG